MRKYKSEDLKKKKKAFSEKTNFQLIKTKKRQIKHCSDQKSYE